MMSRLILSVVMQAHEVSYSALAREAGLSRSALYSLATHGIWPARSDPDVLQQRLRKVLQEKGVPAHDLADLFDAAPNVQRRSRGPAAGATATTQEDLDMLLPKQALSPQARRHFKLFTNPFDGEVTSDEMMFTGDDFAYVREAAWQCSQTGGFVAVCGESGAGKTTVLLDLEARLERDPRGVIVIKPSVLGMEESDNAGKTLKSTDILHAIITQLDAQHTVPQSLQARTVRARKLLAASAQAGNTHLLVVDEAHSMPDATLKHLKRLHELREGRRPLLGILLLGQPELKLRLAAGLRSGALREVAQRCELVELLPLDADLKPYLERRAAAVNVRLQALIDDAAVEQLRTRLTRKMGGAAVSMCYPLAVNNLVTRALNEAASIGVPVVTRDVIAAV
jgi:type II secretory pathway predicted ATPase ExeA